MLFLNRALSDNRYQLVKCIDKDYRELTLIYLLPFPLYFLSPPELSLPLSVLIKNLMCFNQNYVFFYDID
ncbi:hypothetical protein BvCmsHHNP033_01703 [Escherichia coli]|nr:hypothetical protein BvCmsHHNP033_01703 [Escherichia coli]